MTIFSYGKWIISSNKSSCSDDADWCWLKLMMLTDSDWSWLMLIDAKGRLDLKMDKFPQKIQTAFYGNSSILVIPSVPKIVNQVFFCRFLII